MSVMRLNTMQFTIRDTVLATTGVAFVLLSEAGFSAFSRIIDLAPFELYPIVLPALCLLHIAVAVAPAEGNAQPIHENSLEYGCKWTFALFLLVSTAFISTLFRRWEFAGPMAGMANCINLVNTAISQSIAGVVAIVALRVLCARKLFVTLVSCISMLYWGLVLILHFIG